MQLRQNVCGGGNSKCLTRLRGFWPELKCSGSESASSHLPLFRSPSLVPCALSWAFLGPLPQRARPQDPHCDLRGRHSSRPRWSRSPLACACSRSARWETRCLTPTGTAAVSSAETWSPNIRPLTKQSKRISTSGILGCLVAVIRP